MKFFTAAAFLTASVSAFTAMTPTRISQKNVVNGIAQFSQQQS